MATNVNIPKIHEIFSYNIVPRGRLYGSAKNFKLRVHVKNLHEYYTVSDLTSSTTVTKLKEKLEAITGIPTPLQRLYFLDQCDMVDGQTLECFHILPNSKLSLRLFKPWQEIIEACCKGNVERLEKLLPLNRGKLSEWDKFYIYVAIFVATHRGHMNILERLLQTNVDVKNCLPSGRHPLLIAVQRKQLKCTEVLLGRRVRAHEWSNNREALHNWKVQARVKANYEKVKEKMQQWEHARSYRMTKAQMFDSTIPTWIQGPLAKKYLCIILDGTVTAKELSRGERKVFRP
eukprot:gene10821-19633_t